MGEAVVASVAEMVLKKLGSLAVGWVSEFAGAREELEKLRESVASIKAVVLEAEERRSQDEACRVWLGHLKDVIYDADDLMDEFSFQSMLVVPGDKATRKIRLFFSGAKQLLCGFKMVPRIRDLRARLERLAKDVSLKQLPSPTLKPITTSRGSAIRPITLSGPVGRIADKEAIIESLLHRNCEENVGVVAICGMGGVGKTTLARMVFNDRRVKTEFQSLLWVMVGNDFHVQRIVKDMAIQLNQQLPGMDMDSSSPWIPLLSNKRFLLVLDDVWNVDPEKWSSLGHLFEQGARGSRILLTTRIAKRTPCLMGLHNLGGLSEADSWLLFKQVAFQSGQDPSQVQKSIGREVAVKCAGNPLAIRVMGSMLYARTTDSEWSSFKHRELLQVVGGDCRITVMSALSLSYRDLPPHLKSCLAYCSLFPPNQKIHVPRLINLWIAQGHVKPSDPSQSLEAVGLEQFMELLGRSFFEEVAQDELGNIATCRMHDLVRDLAVKVAGTEFVWASEDESLIKAETLHAAFSVNPTTPWRVPVCLFGARKLRTFLLSNETQSYLGALKPGLQSEEKQLHLIASNLGRLRALDLHGSGITGLPSSFCNLKFLTYLDLSGNKQIKVLPDSITRLLLLQILNLDNCDSLTQLPKDTKALTSLIHLGVENCSALTHMPRGIGHLTSLSKLSRFVLPIDSSISKYGASLGELRNLNGLRGTLRIYNLPHVEGALYEFQAANLKAKKDLRVLRLEWSDGDEDPNDYDPIDMGDDTVAMEALQPHVGLERLELRGYRGTEFASWLPSLTQLIAIDFESCEKCQYLPPLHQLSGLKSLTLKGLTALKYVHDRGVSSGDFFPSLEKLVLSHCPELVGWWTAAPTASPQLELCRLSHLSITACPKLSSTSMPVFPSLKSVKISGSKMRILEQTLVPPQVSSSASSLYFRPSLLALSQLETLEVEAINDLEFLQEDLFQDLMSLKTLRVAKCRRLKTLFQGICHLTSLTVLSIEDCQELDLGDGSEGNDGVQWKGLISLHSLSIGHIPKLEALPHWIQHLTSLWRLEIIGCRNLISLPNWMSRLHSLQVIIILCPKLTSRCKSDGGEDWPKINHIPNIVDAQKTVQEVAVLKKNS